MFLQYIVSAIKPSGERKKRTLRYMGTGWRMGHWQILEQCKLTVIGVDNTRAKLARTEHDERRWYRRTLCTSRACGQKVSVNFVTHTLKGVLVLGCLKGSVALNSTSKLASGYHLSPRH
jgi:hypothetical protein